MRSRVAFLLVALLLGAALLALLGPTSGDPLAPYRAADGSLHIPGGALTPELQHLLFGGNDLQPYYNFTYYAPAPSPYPTARLVAIGYLAPNPNVFLHPRQAPPSLADGVAHLLTRWFPPVDWGAAIRSLSSGFFGLFTWDARAAVTIDQTNTGSSGGSATTTCTTTQTAAAADNGIVVLLTEQGNTAYASVTYGGLSLVLVPGTSQTSGTVQHTEIWGFAGAIPAGSQTVTATLGGGASAKQTCATVLMQKVNTLNPFINGTGAAGNSTNATVPLTSAITGGDVGLDVLGVRGIANPSGVSGTGAVATALYGTTTALCTSGNGNGSNTCGAGAYLPSPGTAFAWTSPFSSWASSAVEVVAGCGSGGAGCYRVGAGGTWTSTTNWSNASGGAPCNCSPAATDSAILNASATGTIVLVGATTIAGINMTGFGGVLDTVSGSNYPLTVNGNLTIQGTFLPEGSAITVSGNVAFVTASTVVNLSSSTWAVGGRWTNNSTSGSWSVGSSTVAIQDGLNATMTFGNLAGNEFNNLTLDTTAAGGLTYTMATNGLRVGGTLLIRNSVAGATGATLLDTSLANLGVTAGALTLASWGGLNSEGSPIAVGGNVNISAATGYVASTGGSWTVQGSWTDASTSTSWAFAAAITFSAAANQAMAFRASAPEFAGAVTFDTTNVNGMTYTLATNALSVGGLLTVRNSTTTPTGNTILDTTAANRGITAGSVTLGTSGTLLARGSTINVGGTWTATAPNATFVSGTSTVIFTASTTVAMMQPFNNVTVATGTASLGSALSVAAVLTVSGGTLAKGTNAMTLNTVTLSGGAITSTSGDVTVSGNLAITSVSSYIAFGSETWTVSGSWANGSASALWSAGTATVLFNASSSQTLAPMTGTANEFYNLTFNSGPNATTFTLGTNGLRVANALTVQGGSATTTLSTSASNLPLTAGLLTVAAGGALTANGSTITVNSVDTSGGSFAVGTSTIVVASSGGAVNVPQTVNNLTVASGVSTTFTTGLSFGGTLTLTSSAPTFNGSLTAAGAATLAFPSATLSIEGSWDTASAASFSAASSSVVFTGASATVALGSAQSFFNLTIAGTVSLSTPLTVAGTLSLADAAILTKTGESLSFNSLAENGTGSLADGSLSVVNLSVANSDPTNLTTISSFSLWIVNTEYTWTDSSTVGTSTLTFTIGGNGAGGRFNVTKDGAQFTTGVVNGSGQIVFTMLGSDPVVDVVLAAPCGSTRYWVGGAGTWSATGHWSAVSGGAGGCSVPNGSMDVVFDGNSGGGTASLDGNDSVASVTTTGWTGTFALGGFSLAVGGNLTLGSGTITLGASTGTGLTVAGNLVLSGTAVLDGSGAASLVGVTGNVSVTSPTASMRMGSGTWTFGGSWTNLSTSASWSAGTGTVVFDAATSQTMTFAALGSNEFYHVAFSSLAASGSVTFTLATNALRWGGTLTIQDAAGSTTTLATANLGLVGGSIAVGTAGLLTANGSTVSVVDVTMNGGTSGSIALTTGAWTVSGTWDTSGAGSTFTKGTSTVTLSGTAKTVKLLDAAHGFYNLTVSGTTTLSSASDVIGALAITGTLTTAGQNLTGGANLTIAAGGSLNGSTSSLALGSVTLNDAAADTIFLTAGSLSISGSWDSSGASAQLLLGTSTVTFTGASAIVTLAASQAFANLVVTGSLTLASPLAAASLSIPSGSLAKGTYPLTVTGDLTLSGGNLTSLSGSVSVSGSVDISSAASFIAFGTEAWTVSGSWTNASTSASWSAGTGTVTFNASSSQTMSFAGSGLGGVEFNAVVFNAGAATATFTLAGSGLVARTITVQDAAGSTTLNTSGANLSLTADSLTVGAGGTLTANGSVLTVHSMDTFAGGFAAGTSLIAVSASGGTIRIPQVICNLTVGAGLAVTFTSRVAWTGTLTFAGAAVTLANGLASSGPAALNLASATVTAVGSWDTSTASVFGATLSSVTFTGVGVFLTLGAGQQFASLSIAGGVTLGADLAATSLAVNAGATLDKTNFAITFNALSVGGTLADGTANVTGLTVTNSDTTALVTVSLFTTWTAGSSYAWTHTSNETAQTITWTIGGNTAGFLYSVTKDGSSFKDGTVDKSGQVQFTMLGSDPSMKVSVAAPPPPPWWQAPYVLAMPPTALIVVIAMFAQRQRWRPTKAFLVDERGQLLREFTLDPKCRVTYEEARKAGALDAVDKDVRVSRYHARAVHGDMLSLIMLAIGPADVQEVEFARGLLASVQDKFEDGVKQRAQEVRAAETAMDTAHRQAQEEHADLQARARVFGDMVNAFTIARGKLDNASRDLHAQSENLSSRELRVGEDRKNLDEEARELETLRASLDKTSENLEARRREIEETSRDLEERAARIMPKEQELTAREAAVTQTESGLAGRRATLESGESQLAAGQEALRSKADDVSRLETDLNEERKSLDDLSGQLDQREHAVQARDSEVESREKAAEEAAQQLTSRQSAVEGREQTLSQRESDLSGREASLERQADALGEQETQLRARADELAGRETTLTARQQELEEERHALDQLTAEAVEERKVLDAKAAALREQESEVARQTKDLTDVKENLGPREAALLAKESDLQGREKALAEERSAFQSQQELVERKALEIQQQMEAIKEQETTLTQEKTILQDAKGAFDSEHKEFEARIAAFGLEMERRKDDFAAQERTLGDARLQLTKDREGFDAQRAEKNQWIASKEIELEAKEQTLTDREADIRKQAEENADHLAELAAREETLEIESDKLDKARADLESRKAELAAMARDLEGKTARFRDEESRKGEELRTWQSTLESEQALLKEQRETFEKEMQDLRESWAGRMIRVEQKEDELKEREAKVQTDVEWVARNEAEIGKREKAAAESLRAGNDLKTEGERLRGELDQRALEIESRDRSLREEAASQSIELEKRTEALQAAEADLAGRKAQSERELATQVQKLKEREVELQSRQEALQAREAELASREAVLMSHQDALREDEDRLARERADLGALDKQLEVKQLDLTQARERFDAESLRARTEMDAVRQSLAAKEADLLSERERLERESAALQDKLGAKAREMAAREKAVAAREDELRSEEHDLDARIREIDSRDRQTEARLAEMVAREKALSQGEQEQKARRASFDESVQTFEAEADARKKEWQDLQSNLRSQEAQLAANTETHQAEIRKRMEDLEQKEHSLNALMTQAQIERTQLEAQAKSHASRSAEIDASAARSEKRFTELKAMEDELLKARQTFESEKAGWAARRSEELKQLEATRDAAAEQTQQAERLIEDSQRRVYVAAESEKAAKRQGEELATAQTELERRRKDAEKAEKDLQNQMAQLREASQKLGAQEMELAARTKQLDALQARLADAERKGAETANELKARKATLDQEADRLATAAAQLDKRAAEAESRHAAVEAKLAEVVKREQVVTTELQRADNLMDDLNRKEAELTARDRAFASRDEGFAKREQALGQRDAELLDGMQALERMKKEHEARATQADADHQAAAQARKEADGLRTDAERMKAQAESMQAEVSKNMRFLQKKALDVLDREEKIRAREGKAEDESRILETRTQILEQKERSLEAEKEELTARLEKAKQETEKLRAKLADLETSGKATVDMDEWKRDIENRVKIIQKKALDLLDREERLRKREEELKALAAKVGVPVPP